MNRFLTILVASVLTPVLASTASAAVIMGDTADAQLHRNYGSYSVVSGSVSATTAQVSDQQFGGINDAYVSVFKLPDVGLITDPFTSATASFTLLSASGNNWVSATLVAVRSSSSSTVLATDSGGTGIGLTFNPSTALGVKSTSSASLLSFLNTEYNTGAGAGNYVFLSFVSSNFGDAFWSFATADNATEANRPTLDVTVIPEPASLGLLAAGAVLALRRRRR